jgi:Bacterial translation initiation factor IF-2 associated region
MGKHSFDQGFVRQTFSHARTKPVVVETVKRRTAPSTDGKAVLLCPSCGARMKLVRIISKRAEGHQSLPRRARTASVELSQQPPFGLLLRLVG